MKRETEIAEMVYHRDPEFVRGAFDKIIRDKFQGDDYTIRLWEAEAKLESLGYKRGIDGKWRKNPTDEDTEEMARIRELTRAPWRPFSDKT